MRSNDKIMCLASEQAFNFGATRTILKYGRQGSKDQFGDCLGEN
jgi:hypothetical protein